jgi:2-polyprenyl-6-methoxyphenol hydroxylase-like FAD-dependent oxidoreductase
MSGVVLKRLGINVRIFERSPSSSLSHQGAGIVFGPEAQEFFSEHIAVNRQLTVSSKLRQTLDRRGEVKDDGTFQRREQKMVSWDLLYFVLRANFDGLASRYCDVPETRKGDGKGEYEYGCTVTALQEVEEGIKIEFHSKDGESSEIADLVIAADGPSSTIRKLLAPDVVRKYVGYVAWRGTIPESEASELIKETFAENFTFYHGPGIQILTLATSHTFT